MRNVSFLRHVSLTAIVIATVQALPTENLAVKVGGNATIGCLTAAAVIQKRFDGSSTGRNTLPAKAGRLIRNATSEESGLYECLDENGNVENKVCLTVGDVPGKPTEINCETHSSLEYLDCYWNVSKATAPNVTHFFKYVHYMTRHAILTSNMTVLSRGYCKTQSFSTDCKTGYWLPLQHCRIETGYTRLSVPSRDGYAVFRFTAVSENIFGKGPESDYIDQDYFPSNLVKPAQPCNVTVTVTKEKVNTSVLVTWDRPDMAKFLQLEYFLRYRINGGQWKYTNSIANVSWKFFIRDSGGDLAVQVRAGSTLSDSFAGIGKSDWSSTARALLPIHTRVKPAQPCNVTVTVTKEKVNTSVVVTWDRPDVAKFLQLEYFLRYRINGGQWKYTDSIANVSWKFFIRDSGGDLAVQVCARSTLSDSFAGVDYSDWSSTTRALLPTNAGGYTTTFLVGFIITLGLLIVVLMLVTIYKKRKKLKSILIEASDRRIPSPNIFIALPSMGQEIAGNDRHHISESSQSQIPHSQSTCFRTESFTEIDELLLRSHGNDGDEIPDYAIGMVQKNTPINNIASSDDTDRYQDQSEAASSELSIAEDRDNLLAGTARDEDCCSKPTSSGQADSRRTVANDAVADCADSDYACSYSTVPGYLSCTTPQDMSENCNSSVETLTDYAMF